MVVPHGTVRARLVVTAAACALLALSAGVGGVCAASDPTATPAPVEFNAGRAWTHLERIVAIGPRVPGTPGSAATRAYLREHLEAAGATVEEQAFPALTPLGPLTMTNVVATMRGSTDRVVVVSAHYDTKRIPEAPEFVGANDSASGVAVLLGLAEALAQDSERRMTLWFVCYDGEEAFGPWSDTDGIYGSRAFVRRLQTTGELARVAAAINLDMIGDEHLRLVDEQFSTRWLMDRLWSIAAKRGHGRHFTSLPLAVTDDHVPFLKAGIPAVDLIDFSYGPASRSNEWWHTAEDTLEHCRPQSLGVVGDVVLTLLRDWPSERPDSRNTR